MTGIRKQILDLIDKHGPLKVSELLAASGAVWSELNEEFRALERGGFVVMLSDDRARLTVMGRKGLLDG